MQDLKKGDIIVFQEGDDVISREEVLARLEDIVFTRILYDEGAVGSLQAPQLIEDLITYGFKKEG